MKCIAAIRLYFRLACIKLVLNAYRYTNACLVVVGTALLVGGLIGISTAQVNLEPVGNARLAPGAAGRPAPIAIARPAPPAIARPAPAADVPYNDSLPRFATGNLFMLIEGAFGALIMVAAGLGALFAAAMGAYKMALTLLVVAVGAFILRALVSLFFGTNYPAYNAGVVGINPGAAPIIIP